MKRSSRSRSVTRTVETPRTLGAQRRRARAAEFRAGDRTRARVPTPSRPGGRLRVHEGRRGRRIAARAKRRVGADRVGAFRGPRRHRQVRGGRGAGRDRQDGAARGGAECGGRRRNAGAPVEGDRAGAGFCLRGGASAVRAGARRGIGARARRSAAGRRRGGGRLPRTSGRTPCPRSVLLRASILPSRSCMGCTGCARI